MPKPKLIRITTVPLSLEKLLEGQLRFMQQYYDVIAISSEKERLEAFASKEGIRSFYIPLTRKITPFQDLHAVYRLYRFLKKEQPSIIHSHTPKAGIIGMLAAWLARVPVRMHTVAGLPLMETKGLKRKMLLFVEKLTYRCATKVYPNSKGLSEFILRAGLLSSTKLQIIGNGSSNGIDINFFQSRSITRKSQELKTNYGIPSNDFVFIFIGRMVKDKGMVELINSFVKLQMKFPELSLLLVGPFEQELDPLPEKTLSDIHAHPKIFFMDYQDDVRPFFKVSDVLVFPSYREGFPNVVLQALAMEIPAIVTNINGCNEIVEEGFNGWVVPSKDTDALYEKMLEAYSHKEKRLAQKQKTRHSILKYDRQIVWEALLEEYQHLLSGIY